MSRKIGYIGDIQRSASELEATCARLSGGFYYERSGNVRDFASNLMYVHGIGWAIGQDLETLDNSQRAQRRRFPFLRHDGETSGDSSFSAEYIRDGIYRPIIVPRNPKRATFRSDGYDYTSSQHTRVVKQDVLTVYELLLSQLVGEIGTRTYVPREEMPPLFAYALHMILDDHEKHFDARTGFRSFAAQHKYPFGEEVVQQAREFLTDLKLLADFPLEDLLTRYIATVQTADNGDSERAARQLSPYKLFWDRSSTGKEEESEGLDEEFSVDPERYKRVLELRDNLVEVLRSTEEWNRDEVLESMANFYFESNPWNYLVYFEPEEGMNRSSKLVPSKRREEPVYVDYTGNLGKVRNWMKAIVEGTPVSHLALMGAAGTGKTGALIKAAEEHNIKVVSVDLNFVMNSYLPDVIRQVRNMSEYPFVIYIDNVDLPEEKEYRPMLYHFVNNLERQMEGPTALGGRVKFAMSTSTYDGLPTALQQRFNVRLTFPKPDMEQQHEIMAAHMDNLGIDGSPDEVLRHVYETEDLNSISEERHRTPRELKDGAIDYTLEKI